MHPVCTGKPSVATTACRDQSYPEPLTLRKVTEQGLIEILEKVSQQTEKKTTVKFNRRKVMDSDEDDDY
ncbi:Programmed cell death protein 5 [Myotis brandtii]|uniref:Programmed cell death protein 5 n=1 Tax=Myotis brandtii TaxID=109478 RepID=S7PC95_MYOBR|nr:Programmed cell death protein 5 [Myotis brandtii]